MWSWSRYVVPPRLVAAEGAQVRAEGHTERCQRGPRDQQRDQPGPPGDQETQLSSTCIDGGRTACHDPERPSEFL